MSSSLTVETQLEPKPKLFYERDSVVTTVDQALHGDKPYLILHGKAGTGKTTLARFYAHQFLNQDPDNRLVLEFTRCDFDRKLFDAYMDILKSSHRFVKNIMTLSKKPLIDEINAILATLIDTNKKQILLIFDHVESYDIVSDYILTLPAKVRVIIATRHEAVCDKFSSDQANKLKLDEFSQADFEDYLKRNCLSLSHDQITGLFELILNTSRNRDTDTTISPVNAHKAVMLIKNNSGGDPNDLIEQLHLNAKSFFVHAK